MSKDQVLSKMNPAGDFQILKVLNPRTTSDLFLVKNLSSNEIIVWRTILLRNLSKEKKETLCNKLRHRLQQDHPLLVKFFPVIEDERMKLIYVPMEYFPHGNLSDFLKTLAKSDKSHISEDIIVKFLFQLMILLKGVQVYDHITLKNIFFDDDFNIKFLNFSLYSTQAINIKMCDIGNIIKQMCSLSMCNQYVTTNDYYTSEFRNLIETMLQDTTDVYVNFDKIIQHPVILLNTFKLNCGLNLNNCFEVLDLRLKLEHLRKKEALLKAKELNIDKKEHSLNVKAKKLAINEKNVKDKMIQAELYLKRCKENKINQIHKYENIDSSLSAEYDELDCSDMIETSRKLCLDKLEKPFIRTFSERKVRFKGHSPLREMNFHRSKSSRKPKIKAEKKDNTVDKEKLTLNCPKTDLFKDISNTEKSLLKPVLNNEDKKRRSVLFGTKSVHVQDENMPDMDCRPIAWTEESKKQAFDLLRIMNSTVERKHWTGDIKHTYL